MNNYIRLHFSALIMLLASEVDAATIVWPAVGLFTHGEGQYVLASELAAATGGSAGFEFEAQVSSPFNLTLIAWGATAAVGHSWFETAYGSPIDMTAASLATPFVENFSDDWTPVNLYLNQVFYLGFWLDADWSGTPSGTTDIYGWAALLWDGTELTLVDSAAETTGVGIYAGTYDAIPEPSTAGLLLVGIAAFVLRRRRTYSRLRSGC